MSERNSYDDLETDYLEEEAESGFLSLMSVVVAFIAVAIFIALAWYAYQTGTDAVPMKEMEVVYPDEGVLREAPEDAGGWQFPDEKRSVYNIIASEEEEVRVEKILPSPEAPIERPKETLVEKPLENTEVRTETWMNQKLQQKPIAKTDAERLQEAQKIEENPVKEAVRATEKAVVKTTEVAQATKETVKEAVKAPVKPIEKEVTKPATVSTKEKITTAVGGQLTKTRLQLGAFRSNEEAKSNWKTLMKKYPGLIGKKALHIERADIAGKGTYYRIHLYPFDNKSQAVGLCKKLSAKGQACFPVVR